MILGETITREEGGPLHPPVEQQLAGTKLRFSMYQPRLCRQLRKT